MSRIYPELAIIDTGIRTVTCDEHGAGQPCYVMCPHIQTSADIGYFEQAEYRNIGQILCRSCKDQKLKSDDAHLECEGCLIASKIIIRRKRVTP